MEEDDSEDDATEVAVKGGVVIGAGLEVELPAGKEAGGFSSPMEEGVEELLPLEEAVSVGSPLVEIEFLLVDETSVLDSGASSVAECVCEEFVHDKVFKLDEDRLRVIVLSLAEAVLDEVALEPDVYNLEVLSSVAVALVLLVDPLCVLEGPPDPLSVGVPLGSPPVAEGFVEVSEPVMSSVVVGLFVEEVALVGVGSLADILEELLFVEDAFVGVGSSVDLGGLVGLGFWLVFVFVALVLDFDFVLEAGGFGSATSPLCAFSGPNAKHLEKSPHSLDWIEVSQDV